MTIAIIHVIISNYMAPRNHLRKKKLFLEAEIVDFIPNEDTSCQKITRVGSSNTVVLPNQWSMFFNAGDDVFKALLKVRIPALRGIAKVEYNCMLVVDTKDFPLEKVVKQK